jgi:hypothetical protein
MTRPAGRGKAAPRRGVRAWSYGPKRDAVEEQGVRYREHRSALPVGRRERNRVSAFDPDLVGEGDSDGCSPRWAAVGSSVTVPDGR